MESNTLSKNIKLSWESYINSIIEQSSHSYKTKERLKELLRNIPKITISSYRKIALIEAEEQWKLYKSNNRDLFSNFFQRVYKDMEVYDIDYIEKLYKPKLDIIASTLSKDYEEIRTELINLNYYIKRKDIQKTSEIKIKLIEYYRRFVMLFKKKFIDGLVLKKLNNIKDRFELLNRESVYLMDPYVFISSLKINKDFIDILKNELNDNFNIDINNSDFERLLLAIVRKDEKDACDILKIIKPAFYNDIDEMKALKRLKQNYFPRIISMFSEELLDDVKKYLNDPITNSFLKKKFDKRQLILLNDVIVLMNESKSKIDFSSGDKFISVYKEYGTEEKKAANEYEINYRMYEKFKSKIYDLYKKKSQIYAGYEMPLNNNISESQVPFNDKNYVIENYDYLFNTSLLINFISKIDGFALENMPDYIYMKLKELINKDNLFASILYGNFNQIKLEVIINNFSNIYFNTDFSLEKDNLSEIFKKIKLYEYATDEQIKLLGEDVVRKIVTNNQFMSGNITSKDIILRVKKAVDLMKRAEKIDKSAVPYNCDVYKNGVHVIRYLNNDPNVLVSGIDANTCFKLSANDNDFVFYTILNKNGFVLKFIDDSGKLIGRISGIRRNNILQFNSIRNSENTNIISSKEQYDLYNNMLIALEAYAEKIIEVTKDSECPIDFVVTNKSGLLESSEFSNRYEMLNPHLFSNPIDIYSDDWKDFVHTYDNYDESYFQQVDENTIFTTDFGSYPVVLIKAREGKRLERLFDISYNDPEPIYERPTTIMEKNYVDLEEIVKETKGSK